MGAGGLASMATLGMPAVKASGEASQPSTERNLKVLVAGGHPGDPEYGCGGTVARYTSLGHEVVLLYLNDGTHQAISGPTRTEEAKKACELLKARPVWAGQTIDKAVVDNEHYDAWAKILDEEEPDIVFTQWPIDNHPDHRATAMLTYGAWVQSKRKFSLYYYEVSNGMDTLQFSPTHYIDITDQEPIKRAACYAHAKETPDIFYPLQDQVARFRGIECGRTRAEAFILQVQSPDDPLRQLARQARPDRSAP
jgi:LmbE family N-acetylglucosaminyl deacetylase